MGHLVLKKKEKVSFPTFGRRVINCSSEVNSGDWRGVSCKEMEILKKGLLNWVIELKYRARQRRLLAGKKSGKFRVWPVDASDRKMYDLWFPPMRR
jgi:hypothetical protein